MYKRVRDCGEDEHLCINEYVRDCGEDAHLCINEYVTVARTSTCV